MEYKLGKAQLMVTVTRIICFMLSLYFLVQIFDWYQGAEESESILNEVRESVEIDEIMAVSKVTVTKADTSEVESPFLSVDFTGLTERNSDTVAWLRIDAAGVDMPIVQTTDNELYLDRNFDKNKSKLGWVFADTRSNVEHLGLNTVLYGHNGLDSKMFGSLKALLNTTEETKSLDEKIQFTTLNSQMVFEIVSVYITNEDNWVYVEQSFSNSELKSKFIESIKKNNQVEAFAKNDLSVHDKYLTLSTCHGPAGTDKRLVVHAKLVNQNR